MGFQPNLKLKHRHYPIVYIIGNGNDVEIGELCGRVGWEVKKGTFTIQKMCGVKKLFVNGKVVEDVAYDIAKNETQIDPILVRAPSVIEIISRFEDLCRKCNSEGVRVTFGICEKCAISEGLVPCTVCGRWVKELQSGLCNVCNGVSFYPWIVDTTRCQYGKDLKAFGVCQENICYNCPFLSGFLDGSPLDIVAVESGDKEDIIVAKNRNARVVLYYFEKNYRLMDEKTVLADEKKVIARIRYLIDNKLLSVEDSTLGKVKKYFEERDNSWNTSVSASWSPASVWSATIPSAPSAISVSGLAIAVGFGTASAYVTYASGTVSMSPTTIAGKLAMATKKKRLARKKKYSGGSP